MKKFLFASLFYFSFSIYSMDMETMANYDIFNEETGEIELPDLFPNDEDDMLIELNSKEGQYLAVRLLKHKFNNEEDQEKKKKIQEKLEELQFNAKVQGHQTIARNIALALKQ